MNNLGFAVINLVESRKEVVEFFKNDKQDGIKKAWYYYHRDCDAIMAIDTRDQFNEAVSLYETHGFKFTKTISVTHDTCGAKIVKLHVYRNENESMNLYGYTEEGKMSYDTLSMALGYKPADCECVIAEVTHVLAPVQPKKKKRK